MREGYIKATKNGVDREFRKDVWDNMMPDDHYGWRAMQESEQVEVEIIEKKNLAQEQVDAKSAEDNIPGSVDEPGTGVAPEPPKEPEPPKPEYTNPELRQLILDLGFTDTKALQRMKKSELIELYGNLKDQK